MLILLPLRKSKLLPFYFLSTCLLLLTSCHVLKHIPEGKQLLVSQKIKLHPIEKIDGKKQLTGDLQTQLSQRINNKSFGLFYPGLWFYYHLQDPGDTTKFDRWQARVFAEVPTFADSLISEQIRLSLESVLYNNGFYDGAVEYELFSVSKKKAKVVYHVFPEREYKLNKLTYTTKDTVIQPYLLDLQANTLFEKGQRIESRMYDQETQRITNTLKNKGFANFNQTYINPILADTINNILDVTLEIVPPAEQAHHQRYYFNEVSVNLELGINSSNDTIRIDTIIDGVHFYSGSNRYIVNPNALQKLIYFRPGELYNQDNIDFTSKKLGSLVYFKFIKIRTDIDPSQKDKINASIYLTQGKKQELGLDYEILYESNTNIKTPLLGAGVNLNYKSKNIFNGGEAMNARLETSILINPSPSDIQKTKFINTIDIKLSDEIRLPKFSNFLHVWDPLNKIRFGHWKLIKESFYSNMKKLATTNIAASYSYTSIDKLYTITALNLGYGINYQKSNYERYQFTHLGISFINTKLDPAFDTIISKNIFLKRSFAERQLFTGVFFRDFTYTYFSKPNRWGEDYYGRFNFELSGGEVWLVNNTVNLIRKQDINFSERLQFSQFAKMEVEGRYNKRYSKPVSIAARALIGVIQGYGYTLQTPYVKQFFVGGPNSLRAWRIRELGPGTYFDTTSKIVSTFYQTGDFKIELNAELRFNLFWQLKGALFVDIGNVWDLQVSTYGRKGVFTTNFYKEFGIGSGVGIRADFNFFVIRFDAGIKLYDPGIKSENANKWVFKPGNIQLRDFNPNIAIGYPF